MKIEISDNGKWQNSFTVKMILLAVTGLFLLIPLEMIKSMIRERQKNSEEVRKEISDQWAGNQIISGPVLNVPLIVHPSEKDDEPYRTVFHILPEQLLVNGNIMTSMRNRSIYRTVVFNSDISLSGNFVIPEIKVSGRSEILWKEAYFSIGISDNRGIRGTVSLTAAGKEIDAIPGLRDNDLYSSGITFPSGPEVETGSFPFSLVLKISGSGSINLVPLGRTTRVNLASAWNAPKFTGKFLPAERSVTSAGFKASWLVTDLNRNFPQSWTGDAYNPSEETFGTEFILEADHYRKSERSAKYGILFIALTFLALLFLEITTKEKINFFHYLLLALGLVLFFSLLSALSEHIGFNLAYLAASASTIIMIIMFLRSLLHKIRPAILIGGMLIILYSFIFVLLTLKDYAWLAGNIGLFILMAITMKLSLKLKEI
jgi:inner membrane protein